MRGCITLRSGLDDAYESLFKSKVFRSEMVMQEFNSIVKEVMGLSQMSSRFPDFDLSGKQMYLDKMENACGRYEVFIKRLELADDPNAKAYLTATNAQMLEGGFTIHQMFMGFRQSLGEYRKWVEQEERASVDPAAHQQFLKDFRVMWSQSALGKLDLSYLLKTSDPSIIVRAQKDPRFWVAIREISTNPSSETIAKWLDDENIGPLVAELWKSMQQQRGQS